MSVTYSIYLQYPENHYPSLQRQWELLTDAGMIFEGAGPHRFVIDKAELYLGAEETMGAASTLQELDALSNDLKYGLIQQWATTNDGWFDLGHVIHQGKVVAVLKFFSNAMGRVAKSFEARNYSFARLILDLAQGLGVSRVLAVCDLGIEDVRILAFLNESDFVACANRQGISGLGMAHDVPVDLKVPEKLTDFSEGNLTLWLGWPFFDDDS